MTMATLSTKQKQERLSAALVMIVFLTALGLGWVLKNGAANQTRPFGDETVSAQIPAGWLTHNGTGDLVLVARNSRALNELYRVNIFQNTTDLIAAAQDQNSERTSLDDSYRVLEQTPIVVNGRDGYKVSYAFVDAPEDDMPAVIEGVDYYFIEGSDILVISYEAETAVFAEGVEQFRDFRDSVALTGGSQ